MGAVIPALVCNPNSQRARAHRDALAALALPEPVLIPWEELLRGGTLSDRLPPGSTLRFESFGDDADVEALLMERGGEGPRPEGGFGRFQGLAALRRGLEAVLTEIASELDQRNDLRILNPPGDILDMNDKARTRALLRGAGVAVAPALPGAVPVDAPRLREAIAAAGWPQAFVKARHGSSASGIVALRRQGQRWVGYTTLEEAGGGARYFNTRRLRRVTDLAVLDRALDRVLAEGAVVERWVPKRRAPGTASPMDVRVVCIAGEPRHAVLRLGSGPMTNLHLGGRREPFEPFAEAFPGAAQAVLDGARGAAAAFPRSLAASVDVALETRRDRAVVLEVNAFGELLHGVTSRGQTPYEALWSGVTHW